MISAALTRYLICTALPNGVMFIMSTRSRPDPDRSEYIQKLPFSKDDVHAVRGGEQEAVPTLRQYGRSGSTLDEYGVKFLDKMAKSDKPFFLCYGTRGCHFDNYPNAKYAGSSPARTRRLHGGDRRYLRQSV